MVMLGCVRELLNCEVVLGLPSGLKGYLPVSNICDAYTAILSNAVNTGTDLEVTGKILYALLFNGYKYNVIIIIIIKLRLEMYLFFCFS